MNRHLIPILLMLVLAGCSSAQSQQSMTVMFYNTENLFDTLDDPDKNDDDFTPGGDYRWTEKRYWNKLDAVAKVIAAVGDGQLPALVGLSEVENDRVMTDLTARSALKKAKYSYFITNSPDSRGIDVALLYRRSQFQPVLHESIPVNLKRYGTKATRDILHVAGRIASLDTVDVFVCHWPSRGGGELETEPKRIETARQLRKQVDKVIATRRKPYIIIMGDLNDCPSNASLTDGLDASPSELGASLDDDRLVTLMDNAGGSYCYRGHWEQYDQFVVSASFLNGLGCCNIDDSRVYRLGFLMEDDDNYGGQKPFRTFVGRRYQAGYSDHLPIGFTFSY